MQDLSQQQILAGLNPQQQLATAHVDGPLLVLAGPGSGKTRVITHRIAHLIASGVPSENIVALTFTNKAAEEMRSRIRKLAPGSRAWTSTFHRFCSRLIRQHAGMVGLKENFTIYDAGDSKKVIKQAIENAEVDLKHYSADKLAAAISNVKNHGVTTEQFQPRVGNAVDAIVARVYPEYQKLLQLANGVDFDDLLLYAVELLRNSPELRQSLDEHFRYMLVDEYQDTNLAQYQLIRLLNHNYQNLAVTGDPDQSIYGWRGANINNILHFERDYQDVKVVRLEQNYRSTQAILRVADQLIKNNTQRKEKSLVTENEEGDAVRLVAYPSTDDEAVDIADTIALAISRGQRSAKDFAILYRANYLSRSFEHALRSAGVPYQVINGHEFYQRREIKDLLAYLYLLNNPDDNVALERIINVPSRKIGKVTLGRLRRYAQDHRMSMLEAAREVNQIDSISNAASKRIAEFVTMVDRLSSISHDDVAAVLRAVLSESDYRNWLIQDGTEEAYQRADNVDELLVAAEEFDRDHPGEGGLEAYLEQTALFADTDIWDSENDFVTLMTLHAAKGLEFPSVFIIGLEDGILPHERSSQDDLEVEEERRLLFVGITRAQQSLQISRCQTRFRRGSNWPTVASRFLMEMPRHEMAVFEPSRTAFSHDDLELAIGSLDDWDDLPSIDINDDNGGLEKDAGSVAEESETMSVTAELESAMKSKLLELAAARQGQGTVSQEGSASAKRLPQMLTGADIEARDSQFQGAVLTAEQQQLGARVEHAEFGVGKIVKLSGSGKKRMATIRFPEFGDRTFHLAFVKLKLVK